MSVFKSMFLFLLGRADLVRWEMPRMANWKACAR